MTKLIMILLIANFFLGATTSAADAKNGSPEYLLFLGNPGVGKSTLINSLVGKQVVESGISIGTGLTKVFSSHEHEGRYYLDTPGLADLEAREEAAKQIERALKENGTYRIFFVITLREGRVMPEDIVNGNELYDDLLEEMKDLKKKIEDQEGRPAEDREDTNLYLPEREHESSDGFWSGLGNFLGTAAIAVVTFFF